MSNSEDVFNHFVGVLACVSVIASIMAYYRFYLPGVQMKILDELLQGAKGIRQSWCRCIPYGTQRATIIYEITVLEENTDLSRQRTYNATTYWEEYAALLQGLSHKIMCQIRKVKRYRAHLITPSEEQKQLL